MATKKYKAILTDKEEEIMGLLWQNGPKTVKELQEYYPEPRPHINTISTYLRKLEEKGAVGHEIAPGGGYVYVPVADAREMSRKSLGAVIKNYFANSYLSAVSSLLEDEKIGIDELKRLIEMVENNRTDTKTDAPK